jgi:uncharacterized protein (DUF3084 family)
MINCQSCGRSIPEIPSGAYVCPCQSQNIIMTPTNPNENPGVTPEQVQAALTHVDCIIEAGHYSSPPVLNSLVVLGRALRESERQLEELQKQNAELTFQATAAGWQCQEVEKKVAELARKLEAAEARITSLKESFEFARDMRDKAEQQLAETNASFGVLKSTLTNVDAQLATVRATLESLQWYPNYKQGEHWVACPNAVIEGLQKDLATEHARAEELARASRENVISARIIHAENEQHGRIYGIRRDAKFILERTEKALAASAAPTVDEEIARQADAGTLNDSILRQSSNSALAAEGEKP